MPSCKALTRLFASILLASALPAQQYRANVGGTISDQSGAKIAGVQVEVKNTATGIVSSFTTTENGSYDAPFLQPGVYDITTRASGFKTQIKTGVELRIGDRLQADFTMEVGGVSEQITVDAAVQQIETTTADLGQVVDAKNTAQLPLLGRNPFQLITVASGVQHVPALASRSDRPFDNGGMDNYNINGSRAYTNEFLLDGTPNTASENTTQPNNLLVAPPPDAVSEFKVQTSSYDAQYGRTGGGTVNLGMKSGTNGFHGAVYDYWRNTVLNANTFEGNRTGQGKVPFHWNQPGVEVDGPVFIPKLYDGRNRTFFMYNWENIRSSVPYAQTYTVPTALARTGDLSGVRNAAGQPITIYDPLTTTSANGGFVRTPFLNNRIPVSRIDPVAARMLTYTPLPNSAGTNVGQNNFSAASNNRSDKYDIHSFRLDQVIGNKNKLFVDVIRSNRNELNGFGGYTGAASPLYTHWRTNTAIATDLTTVINPTTVLDSRVGFTRHVFAISRYAVDFDASELGFPNSFVDQLNRSSFPQISMGSYFSSAACACFGFTGSTFNYSNSYSWSETLSKTLGSHSLKTGFNFRVLQNNYANPTSSAGSFSFTRAFTQANPLRADSGSGDEFASFLLGYPASGSVPVNGAFAYQARYYALFLQDDWRVNDRLTLNFGTRWDYESPVTERYNRQNAGFDISALSPVQINGQPLRGGLTFTNGNNRFPYQRDFNNFQPRIGGAYKISSKTVFRAGYGITYLPTLDLGFNNGFNTSTSFLSSVGNAGLVPANVLSNPYPAGILQPAGSTLGSATLLGQGFTFATPFRVVPYVHQFSAQFQQQLPWKMLLSVGFAGSRTRNLQVTKSINEIAASDLSRRESLQSSVANPLFGQLPVSSSLNTPTVALSQTLRPFPQFTSLFQSHIPQGYASYNSLQVNIDKRFSNGLNFIASYTYSRAMEATSYLNPQDSIDSPAKRISSFDAPQRFSIAGGYALPFFNDKRGFKNALLGGWQVNAIAYIQSGIPVLAPTTNGGGEPVSNSPASTTYSGGVVSTGISPILSDVTTLGQQFNRCTIRLDGSTQNCAPGQQAAWRIQDPYALNTLGLYIPGVRTRRPPQINMSLFKTFNITETVRFQVRGEAFNLFNRPWFAAPNTAVNSAQFGQIVQNQANDPRSIQLALRVNF